MCSGSPMRRSAPSNARPSGVACMTCWPRCRYSRRISPVGRTSRRRSATTSRCMALIDSATREKSAGSSRARCSTFSASSSSCSSSMGSASSLRSRAISASRASRSASSIAMRCSGSVSASRASRSTASRRVRTRERDTRVRPPPARPAMSRAPTAWAREPVHLDVILDLRYQPPHAHPVPADLAGGAGGQAPVVFVVSGGAQFVERLADLGVCVGDGDGGPIGGEHDRQHGDHERRVASRAADRASGFGTRPPSADTRLQRECSTSQTRLIDGPDPARTRAGGAPEQGLSARGRMPPVATAGAAAERPRRR